MALTRLIIRGRFRLNWSLKAILFFNHDLFESLGLEPINLFLLDRLLNQLIAVYELIQFGSSSFGLS